MKKLISPKEYIKQFDLSYDNVRSEYASTYQKVYEFESNDKWIVPIEDKLVLISDEKVREELEKVIDRLKTGEQFTVADDDALSVFTSQINSVVKIADRINNFKQGTKLDDGTTLQLHQLFNAILSAEKLSDLEYELNSNLNAFIPHLYSIIKNKSSFKGLQGLGKQG